MRRKLIVLPIVVAAGLAAVLPAQDDTITKRDGTKVTGKIQDHDLGGIRVSVRGGGTNTIKLDDVVSVDLESAPKEFREGEAASKSGRDDEAVQKLQEVLDNKKARKVHRQEAFLMQAAAQFRLGKYDEAFNILKTMISDAEFPLTHHLGTVHELAFSSLEKAGKHDEAAAFLSAERSRLASKPEAASLVERTELLKCRALLAKGDTAGAEKALKDLAGKSGPGGAEAKAVLGNIALEKKDVAAAEKYFNEGKLVSNPARVRSISYNGAGQILFDKGFESKKPDVIKEALLSYLRTVVQFPPEEGESTQAHETALYRAGMCFRFLAELDKPGEGQKRAFNRARELFRRLTDTYPQSVHVAEAKSELERLGG